MDLDSGGLSQMQYRRALSDGSGGDISRRGLTNGSGWRHVQKSAKCDRQQLSGEDKRSKF